MHVIIVNKENGVRRYFTYEHIATVSYHPSVETSSINEGDPATVFILPVGAAHTTSLNGSDAEAFMEQYEELYRNDMFGDVPVKTVDSNAD